MRAKDAPVETAKFMGHGVCDNIAKSVTLLQHTHSREVILREVLAIAKQIKVPPQDYRGVGVQVSRLNNEGAGPSATRAPVITKFLVKQNGAGQKEQPGETTTETDSRSSEFSEIDVKTKRQKKSIGNYLEKGIPSGEMYSNSNKAAEAQNKTLDIEVLKALPDDMCRQIIEEYRQQGFIIPDIREPKISVNNKSVPLVKNNFNAAEINNKPGPSGYQINNDASSKLTRQLNRGLKVSSSNSSHSTDVSSEEISQTDAVEALQEDDDTMVESFSQVHRICEKVILLCYSYCKLCIVLQVLHHISV